MIPVSEESQGPRLLKGLEEAAQASFEEILWFIQGLDEFRYKPLDEQYKKAVVVLVDAHRMNNFLDQEDRVIRSDNPIPMGAATFDVLTCRIRFVIPDGLGVCLERSKKKKEECLLFTPFAGKSMI